jgi:UDP-N-acetylglucosamine--N-acetylmuramyl-(pentapeptide) pyrophosphoryl-undecaprenol N-acetylglucosamine transferase
VTGYLLAGGGTGGHVNPLLALAEEIRNQEPDASIWTLGTKEGLEAKLVPERGFELLTIERLPFPRKPTIRSVAFPFRFLRAVSKVRRIISEHNIEVVVGFGGYASAPAYLAAKLNSVPFVVHEANALAGIANRIGARFAAAVGICFSNTKLPKAEVVGMPIRAEVAALINSADVKAARAHFGLQDAPTLLVTGGSLGARSINETIIKSMDLLRAAGIQLLHIAGERAELPEIHEPDRVRLSYCSEMHLAIAAASFAVARAGASTVAEFAAVGLPAVFVPYPVGNGEQKFNVFDMVQVKAALSVSDADFTTEFVANVLIPLISNTKEIERMAKAARAIGINDGAARLYRLVRGVLSQ